ncbi:hypothetical protein ACQRXC_29595 (plasmid) [Niallia taxi]
MFSVGDEVIFQSDLYKILHIYDSGYLEIRKNLSNVELVHISELKKKI